jgi:hypothetical protein
MSSPVSHARLGRGVPLPIAWPGGLPCPWTEGTVDTVACTRPPGASDRANEVGPDWNSSPAVPAQEPAWLVGRLRLGSGMPAPAGQIPLPRRGGERASHRQDCSQSVPGRSFSANLKPPLEIVSPRGPSGSGAA